MGEIKEKNRELKRIYTGCTLLDLVVGGGLGMGFPAGKIINIVGDKSSGKTFLACEFIAKNKYEYKNKLEFNYDDGEHGFTFDTKNLYGLDIVSDDSLRSRKIENFDTNVKKFLKEKKKDSVGIYVLDSLDGLSNKEIEERSEKRFKASQSGKEFDEGTYGMKTPKFLSSEFFKDKTSEFNDTNSLLVIISQVREDISPFSFKKFTRSGGKALDFYAHTVLWLSTVKKIKKKERTTGVVIKAYTDKSKTPRPFRECYFNLYFDYGIDNIGSNLDFLFDLRGKDGNLKDCSKNICWDSNKKDINLDNLKKFLKDHNLEIEARKQKKKDTGDGSLSLKWMKEWIPTQENLKGEFEKDFGSTETRSDLIKRIEDDSKMEKELEKRVIEKWESIENEIKIKRKRKYS